MIAEDSTHVPTFAPGAGLADPDLVLDRRASLLL